MEAVELNASIRTELGGSASNNLRSEDIIPGNLYGHNIENLNIQIKRGELEQIMHRCTGENLVVNLKFEDTSKNTMAILKDIQHTIVTDQIMHVDFLVVSLEEKIKVNVLVHPKGEAQGVTDGGVLSVVQNEVEVECVITNIPEKINVDISLIGINGSLHVRDLVLPDGVVCLTDPETTLIVVSSIKEEEETSELEDEEQSNEPEVIKKGKAEEE